jgi:hypothetical protein
MPALLQKKTLKVVPAPLAAVPTAPPVMEAPNPTVELKCGNCSAVLPDPPHGWDRYPSLRLGPAASSRRGRIQRGIQRAFMVSGTTTLSSSAIYDWTMRDRNTGWQRLQRRSVHRALRQVAEPIGRADTPGQPILWRLKTPGAEEPSVLPDRNHW